VNKVNKVGKVGEVNKVNKMGKVGKVSRSHTNIQYKCVCLFDAEEEMVGN